MILSELYTYKWILAGWECSEQTPQGTKKQRRADIIRPKQESDFTQAPLNTSQSPSNVPFFSLLFAGLCSLLYLTVLMGEGARLFGYDGVQR